MMPQVGCRNNKITRHYGATGLKTFLITNLKDIELLLMNNRTYAGEIAHNISAKNRANII
jgi:ribosomal protein L32E